GNFTQYDVEFHDNTVQDVGGEGFYLGSSFYTGTTSAACPGTRIYPHDIVGLRVHNNTFERTGREAIQVGCVTADCEVHGNTVRQAGVRGQGGQNNGIQINPGTTGLLHGNLVVGVSG